MEKCMGFLHTVEKGDTLYALSRRYRVPLGALLYVNPYINVYNLQVGTRCVFPCVGVRGRCLRKKRGEKERPLPPVDKQRLPAYNKIV